MKRNILTIALLSTLMLTSKLISAQNPVKWQFDAKKVDDKTYEIHMTATIQNGWHLYSQTQPENAIAIPTSFVLNTNPLLSFDGKIKEVGKLEKFHDKQLDIAANQYSEKVVFIQKVKLKAKAKTNISGTVEFQTCTDEKCLPPAETKFNISISSI